MNWEQITDLAVIANRTFPHEMSDIIEAAELLNMSLNRLFLNSNQKMKASADQKDFASCSEMIKLSSGVSEIEEKLKNLSDSILLLETEDDLKDDDDIAPSHREIPNYSMYEVDSSIPHTLFESFTHKRPSGFLLNNRKYGATEWKDVLLQTCDLLAQIDPVKFRSFLRDPLMKGRKINYFGSNYVESKNAKMKELDIYVWTNLSANAIKNLIIRMLNRFNIEISSYFIYLRADYSTLHDPSIQ